MSTFKKTLIAASLIASAFAVTIPVAQADINIGVIAPRGELKALKQWSDFGKYIAASMGENVTIKPFPPRTLISAAAEKKVDFILSNPTQAMVLKEVYGATPLATLNKKSGSQFAGVIVAKKGSGISKAEDLKGKKVMSLKFRKAAGAYIFQTYHLLQKGIDPHKDFASITEGKKQDDLLMAVKSGKIDAAFIRTGILEAMEKEGKIKMDEFVIVDQNTTDGFPLAHTTALYPEWYLSSLKGSDTGKAEKIKMAALKLKPSDKAAKRAKIKGFVEPVSMDSMTAALKALKIKPFDK
jgi:twitching motility protein PilJ